MTSMICAQYSQDDVRQGLPATLCVNALVGSSLPMPEGETGVSEDPESALSSRFAALKWGEWDGIEIPVYSSDEMTGVRQRGALISTARDDSASICLAEPHMLHGQQSPCWRHPRFRSHRHPAGLRRGGRSGVVAGVSTFDIDGEATRELCRFMCEEADNPLWQSPGPDAGLSWNVRFRGGDELAVGETPASLGFDVSPEARY